MVGKGPSTINKWVESPLLAACFIMCCYSHPNCSQSPDLYIDADPQQWFPATPGGFSVRLTLIQWVSGCINTYFQRAFPSCLASWRGLFNYIIKRLKKLVLGIFKIWKLDELANPKFTFRGKTGATVGKGSVQCSPQIDRWDRVENSGIQTLNPVLFL